MHAADFLPVSWSPERLSPSARVVSASRRTDIPGRFAPWFGNRLAEGFAEYVPMGPPRLCRASLLPEDVLWFVFWTRWPRPFLDPSAGARPLLDELLERSFPCLFNMTLTGLGGTAVEPASPPEDVASAALLDLCERLPHGAVTWRYDPIFLSDRRDEAWHEENFRRMAGRFAGHVDHIVSSFVSPYRRVLASLHEPLADGDRWAGPDASSGRKADLILRLAAIARTEGLRVELCNAPELRAATLLPASSCNGYDQAVRAFPELSSVRPPRRAPSRPDCGCVAEVDIGSYGTCTFGCRYCYASGKGVVSHHDPHASSLARPFSG
jgi:hypothetical protein